MSLTFEFRSLDPISFEFPRTVGIEIETEGSFPRQELLYLDQNLWSITTDGSLVDGVELVSVPLNSNTIKQAGRILDLFPDIWKGSSVRTSVHIHVDCRRISPYKVLQGFVLLEPYLVGLYSERDGNLFCSPWNGFGFEFITSSSDEVYIREMSKYKTLSLNRYGDLKTVEYRFLPLLPSFDDVEVWATFLSTFTDNAGRARYRPSDVFEFGKVENFSGLMRAVEHRFGNETYRLLLHIMTNLIDDRDEYVRERKKKFNVTDVSMLFDWIDTKFKGSQDYV